MCHGATGAGNGPGAAGLDPPPIAFTDAARARERSLFALYQVLSQGLVGTSMARFEDLPDAAASGLSSYVGRRAFLESSQTSYGKLGHAPCRVSVCLSVWVTCISVQIKQ